jgi:hypothetical protein
MNCFLAFSSSNRKVLITRTNSQSIQTIQTKVSVARILLREMDTYKSDAISCTIHSAPSQRTRRSTSVTTLRVKPMDSLLSTIKGNVQDCAI